jgi:hypothetical protein
VNHYILLLATLMVLAYAYSRKWAFIKFGQTPDGSAGAQSENGQATPPGAA